MLDSLKVSITGDPSSGKTEACHVFRDLGAYVISADKVSHSFLVPHTRVGRRVVDLLGPDIIIGNTLSRDFIARKVFQDPFLLRELEAILHPEVCRFISETYSRIVREGHCSLFVVEVPLLYEIDYASWFDQVLLVVADEGVRKERFVEKTKRSELEFYRRCARFSDVEKKKQEADVVIENNGSKEDLRQKITEYFYSLKGAL